jgi:hypothetical protein
MYNFALFVAIRKDMIKKFPIFFFCCRLDPGLGMDENQDPQHCFFVRIFVVGKFEGCGAFVRSVERNSHSR